MDLIGRGYVVGTIGTGGRAVVVSGTGSGWQVNDIVSGEELHRPPVDVAPDARAVACGEILGRACVVTVSRKVGLQAWDLSTGTGIGPGLKEFAADDSYALVELDGRTVVVVTAPHRWEGGRSVRVWDPVSVELIEELPGLMSLERTTFPSIYGLRVVVGASTGGGIKVGYLRTREFLAGRRIGEGPMEHPGGVQCLAYADVAGRVVLVSGGTAGTIRLWDLASGALRADLGVVHLGPVVALDTTDLDGRPVVLSAGLAGDLRLFDLETGRPAGVLVGQSGEVSSVACADGLPLAVTAGSPHDPRTIRVRDLATGFELD